MKKTLLMLLCAVSLTSTAQDDKKNTFGLSLSGDYSFNELFDKSELQKYALNMGANVFVQHSFNSKMKLSVGFGYQEYRRKSGEYTLEVKHKITHLVMPINFKYYLWPRIHSNAGITIYKSLRSYSYVKWVDINGIGQKSSDSYSTSYWESSFNLGFGVDVLQRDKYNLSIGSYFKMHYDSDKYIGLTTGILLK